MQTHTTLSPRYITVVALWEQNEQTVGQLGDKLFLESNTLTPILKKLAGLGYVTRQRDPLDERQVLVRLTAEGCRLRDNLVQSMQPYNASVSP